MPALNIRYTDDELKALRARADAEGIPVTGLVHDVSLADTSRVVHFAHVMALADDIAGEDAEILKRLAEL